MLILRSDRDLVYVQSPLSGSNNASPGPVYGFQLLSVLESFESSAKHRGLPRTLCPSLLSLLHESDRRAGRGDVYEQEQAHFLGHYRFLAYYYFE